jgi:hypothetical protein
MPSSIPGLKDAFAPLTAAEQERISTLLATVSTQTLLHSLARMNRDNTDASLIIAALLDRLPFEERDPTE